MIYPSSAPPMSPAPMPRSGRRPKSWPRSTFRNGRPAARRRLEKTEDNRNPALHLLFTQGRRRGAGGGGHPGPQAPPARSRPGNPRAHERRGPPGSGDRRRSTTSSTRGKRSSCPLCCSGKSPSRWTTTCATWSTPSTPSPRLGSTIFVGRGDAPDPAPRPRAGRAADLLGPLPRRAPVVAAEGRHRARRKTRSRRSTGSRRPFSRRPSARRTRPPPSSTSSSTSTILRDPRLAADVVARCFRKKFSIASD